MRISDWSSDVCSSDLSEIRSVELERKIAEGITMIERRDTMEFFRECAAEQFRLHLRTAWMPRTGSRAQHKTLTASMIDSREFLDKRLRSEEMRVGKEHVSTGRYRW